MDAKLPPVELLIDLGDPDLDLPFTAVRAAGQMRIHGELGIEKLGILKTDKLLIFQRPKKPKNLQKPIWRYTRGTRKIAKPVSTHQHLQKE